MDFTISLPARIGFKAESRLSELRKIHNRYRRFQKAELKFSIRFFYFVKTKRYSASKMKMLTLEKLAPVNIPRLVNRTFLLTIFQSESILQSLQSSHWFH